MNTIHRTPMAASSLRDFWGRRWNRMVSGWLKAFIFLPLARRQRPGLGLTCAFLTSAAMHAWLVVAVRQLALIRRLKLLTDEELMMFSEPTRTQVEMIASL